MIVAGLQLDLGWESPEEVGRVRGQLGFLRDRRPALYRRLEGELE